MKKHIFIIGSKGIPARYGGFETFVEKLAENKIDDRIEYHVACMGTEQKEYQYQNAECFQLKIPNIGPARAVYYDLKAIRYCIRYVKRKQLQNAELYILACRIGPFIGHYKRQLRKLNMHLYVNPDGHEWLRGKWNAAIRRYWKCSEKLMVKHADLLICDSRNIELYIQKEYGEYQPDTTYISYGADAGVALLSETDGKVTEWYQCHHLRKNEFYLIVGRFVPENNYETMIREFLKSKTTKDLVIVTNIEKNKFYNVLLDKTEFTKDARIKFVGTVYDSGLLNRIRKDAFAYLHGHEVGGTNPSLLEALGITDLNLLLNVGFNREVGEQGALYWDKTQGSLQKLLQQADSMTEEQRKEMGQKAKNRIETHYSWKQIVTAYEALFLA